MPSVDVFRDARAVLAESLWWDADDRALLWCDITSGTITASPGDAPRDGSGDATESFGPPLASFQPIASGGLIAAFRDTVELLGPDGERGTLARVHHRSALTRFNEGKVDPFGSFVVGGMDLAGEPDAAVYRVHPDGRVEELLAGFGTVNGMEWSADGREFYVTDTNVSTVFRADYDPDGPLGELRPMLVGRPSDGLALDVDGCFWNGLYGEGRVLRWSPEGEVLDEIELPVPNITSVAFGGDGLDTLFVASARENLTEQQLEEHPLSGALFAIDPGVTGRPVRSFGGA